MLALLSTGCRSPGAASHVVVTARPRAMRHHRIHQYPTLLGQGQLDLTPVTQGVTSVQKRGSDQPVDGTGGVGGVDSELRGDSTKGEWALRRREHEHPQLRDGHHLIEFGDSGSNHGDERACGGHHHFDLLRFNGVSIVTEARAGRN